MIIPQYVRNHLIETLSGILFFALSITPLSAASNFPHKVKLKNGDLIWARGKDKTIYYNMPIMFEIAKTHKIEGNWKGLIESNLLPKLNSAKVNKKYGYFVNKIAGGFRFEIGHVAIVRIKNGRVQIVEAANAEEGVISSPLAEWINDWSGEDIFWIGRFHGISQANISKIVEAANAQAQKKAPYSLTNLDLSDDKSFYCSKLIWYAAMKTIGLPVDDNPKPNRLLPFSPKQLINSKHTKMIYGQASEY